MDISRRTFARRVLASPAVMGLAGASSIQAGAPERTVVCVPADQPTLAQAVAVLAETGGIIAIAPGVYRERLEIRTASIELRGLGAQPEDVVIRWDNGARITPGLSESSTVVVLGDGFAARNLTIQNGYHLVHPEPSQAPALFLKADRATLIDVRLLGAQDTLFAGSRDPTAPCRQYFRNCHVEGHVDFIFGDALAFFDRCRLHVIANGSAFITAHSRTAPVQGSAYVFDECRITSEGDGEYYLGRAWRPFARVVFLDADIQGRIHPDGWREWTPGRTTTAQTAYFAEYGSVGNLGPRVDWAHALNPAEAEAWRLDKVFPRANWLPAPESAEPL